MLNGKEVIKMKDRLFQVIGEMKPEDAARYLQKRMIARGRLGVIRAGQKSDEKLELEHDDEISMALAGVASVPYSIKE